MNALQIILVVLHIFFAAMTVANIPIAFFFRRHLARVAGTPAELAAMGTAGQLGNFLGSAGGAGLLVTGLLLTWLDGYGLLGLGGETAPTPTSLLVKQVVIIIIFALVMFALRPAGSRAGELIKAAAQNRGPVTQEIRDAMARTETISLIIDLLVIVNVIAGVVLVRYRM